MASEKMVRSALALAARPTESALCLVIMALVCFVPPCLAVEYGNLPQGILSLDYVEGRFSLETKNAAIDQVLEELSRLAGFDIVSDGDLEGKVTVFINRLPADKTVKKVLKGKDLSLIYKSHPDGSTEQFILKEVRIYLSDGKKGQAHRYSPPPLDSTRKEAASRSRGRRKHRVSPDQGIAAPPEPSDFAPPVGAEEFMSGLMSGDSEALNQVAEYLREQNPEFQDQIDQFMESMEEARARAEESGVPVPPMEEMGNMGLIMQQMMKRR